MMPDMDGLRATALLREQGHTMPILLLTAKSEDYDKVQGLNIGADDYITKPFVPTELIARVRAAIRRYTVLGGSVTDDANVFGTGGLAIDDDKKEVTVDGILIKTTPIEYKLLLFLIKNKGHVFSSGEIYERVWNDAAIGADNIVAVHIRHLREKVEINPTNPTYLKVVWGIGYKAEAL
jgi:DNA-binding response OmpR family regulator